MSGTVLSPEEKAAGEIVAERLGGHAIDRDGEKGSHDFDVDLPDGRTVTLQVTAAADAALEALRAQLGRVTEAPTLRDHWMLVFPFDGEINLARALANALPQLEVLERLEVAEVNEGVRRTSPDDAAQAARELQKLGIRQARRWSTPPPGEVARLLPALAGGADSNFDALNALVQTCARRKAPKLLAAGGDERHLFIWMRGSVSDAELAMATLLPPPTVPELPDAADVVWVATGPARPNARFGKLWRLRPPGAWEQLAPGVG